MTLANIMNGKVTKNQLPKATLIVVPSGLRDQWWAEIERHLPNKFFRQCHRFDEYQKEMRLPKPDIEKALIL
jgi:hypothetical protein